MHLAPRVWLIYAVLFAVAVPWYWKYLTVAPDRLVWGMPIWVASSIAGSAAISLFTAGLLCRPWPQEREEEDAKDE